MLPPVAGLVYAVDEPAPALFYPLAAFSPEWVAARWALAHDVPGPLRRPARHPPARRPRRGRTPGARPGPASRPDRAAGRRGRVRRPRALVGGRRRAPQHVVARAVRRGQGRDGRGPRGRPARRRRPRRGRERAPRGGHAPGAARRHEGGGVERIAFVCGAYHAPALDPAGFPPQARDNELLKGLPKTKVAATWAPWSSGRLAFASGYGAGVTSPGWYQHLFDHWSRERGRRRRSRPSWLVRVARELRDEHLDASTASVVEASRLADALAAVRGRPSVGLSELDDAAEAVLCEGSRVPLGLVHDSLVVGRELGAVPERCADGAARRRPRPPAAGAAAQAGRQVADGGPRPASREPAGAVGAAPPAPAARRRLGHRGRRRPHHGHVQGGLGARVAARARGRGHRGRAVRHDRRGRGRRPRSAETAPQRADDLATLGRLVAACLLADLPDGLRAVVAALEERTARQHDVLALLGAVEPLARTVRYGDVRGVDVGGVAQRAPGPGRAGGGRPARGLRRPRRRRRRRPSGPASRPRTGACPCSTTRSCARAGLTSLVAVAARDRVHGSVAGRVDRLLLDAGRIDQAEAAGRMSRRLSVGAPAADAAAWLDGFLVGRVRAARARPGAARDRRRVGQRHRRAGLRGPAAAAAAYVLAVPAARATLDRRAGRAPRRRGERRRVAASERLDLERARPAVARVAALLGLEVRDG